MPTLFQEKVYKQVKKIPKGKTSTYKKIAETIGCKSPRAVGQALKKNPYKNVPCHRVICSGGKIGGYRGVEDSEKKRKLLREEGVEI